MNKNIFTTENILRALGLLLLLLVVLIRGTSVFPHLIPDDKLLYVAVVAAILLGAAYYLRNKRLKATEEED